MISRRAADAGPQGLIPQLVDRTGQCSAHRVDTLDVLVGVAAARVLSAGLVVAAGVRVLTRPSHALTAWPADRE